MEFLKIFDFSGRKFAFLCCFVLRKQRYPVYRIAL